MCSLHVKGVFIFLFLHVMISLGEQNLSSDANINNTCVESTQHGAATAMNKCTRVWQRLKTISISRMPCTLEGQSQLQSVYLLVCLGPIKRAPLNQLCTHGVCLVYLSLFQLLFLNFYPLILFWSLLGLRNSSYIFPSFVAMFQKAEKKIYTNQGIS